MCSLGSELRTIPAALTRLLLLEPQARLVSLTSTLMMNATNNYVATLYDIGTKLEDDWLAKWKIATLSPLALSLSTQPQLLEWNLKSQGFEHIAGHHFFASIATVNTPVFSLDQLARQPQPRAQVAKLNATDAPASACTGFNGLPAVPWLLLKDTQGGSQGGVDTVYRVETAGGNKPATCKGMKPSWEVKYAAQCKYLDTTFAASNQN